MTVRGAFAVSLALVAAAVLPAAAMAQSELSVEQPATLELKAETCEAKKCSTKQATVWVRNAGPAVSDLALAAALYDADGEEVPAAVEPAEGSLGANSVTPFRVSLSGLDEGKSATGQLVATATNAAPGAVELAVSKKRDSVENEINVFLWAPFVFALIFVLICWATWRPKLKPGDPVGSVTLDFTKSFASTLTAVGALLGTLLSSSALPEETSWLTKEEYTALNVVFGVLIAAAGIVYVASQRECPVKDAAGNTGTQYLGRVWAFVLACVLTIWAVVGEVAVLFAIIAIELGGGSFTAAANDLLGLIVALTVVPMLIYAAKSMSWIAEQVAASTEPTRAEGGGTTPYPIDSWSLL